MTIKIKNPLAQALGLVLQSMRDKMGGVSSSEIAVKLGLAASHYRMIEAGSAILQPSRAIKIVQIFDTIEYVSLCQILVAQQILDSVKASVTDMRTSAQMLEEASPNLKSIINKLMEIMGLLEKKSSSEIGQVIASGGLKEELTNFLTTTPDVMTTDQISNFMVPTYEYPMSGQLYSRIGNILQGIAPFYLETVLQLIDNLKDVTPRVTANELASWESGRKNRFSHIIGVIRDPLVLLDFSTFDYAYLWEESFKKILIVYRDKTQTQGELIHQRICELLRAKFEQEHVRYERELETFEEVLEAKLHIEYGRDRADEIDQILQYGQIPMNNLWAYVMTSGYVVPFIDNATMDSDSIDLYGTSLGYEDTCEKLIKIRKLCSEIGVRL